MNAMALLLTLQIVSASAAVPRVPAAVARQVNRSAMTVAQLLANAQVPTGFEVRASDSMPSGQIPDFDAAGPFIAADGFVQAFNAAHADYQASIRDGVVVIRPVGRHLAYLDAPTTIGHLEVRGVKTAARKIFSQLDPRADRPGGVAGSTLGLSPEQAGDTADISLDGYGQTALDLLNHVVIESPRAWYVVISDDPGPVRAVRFGFIQTQGITIGVDLAGNNVTVR